MKQLNSEIEKYRIRVGLLASDSTYGNNGAFNVPVNNRMALCVVSDGAGWEHVSVSFPGRTPTWDEMCKVKSLFWKEEEPVVQYHPPKSEYMNNHAHCLHLWRPTNQTLPRPPLILVEI